MPERIFIGVAWPYANGPLHLGHLAGAYLPADIFARYHRLKGNQVLMVSGSDQHGTPVTVRAEQEGVSPEQVVRRYHQQFLDCWERMGIGFDLFTTTGTANHAETVHDLLKTLMAKGYIYQGSMLLPYCERCQRFLPDRYVEGTCPHCSNPSARGDQCDKCGKTLDPVDLQQPRCRLCGSTPSIQESQHLFFKLSAFREELLAWVQRQSHWKPNVLAFTLNWIKEGLKDRSITRDIDWGVPVPVEGFEKKRIYVWFEAVIGYLSAAKEWAGEQSKDSLWRDFWQGECKAYYFIGKDNIPFHTIIWPAMLMGYGGLNLPYDVPANEFLSLEGDKFSTSRNWAVWLPDYLERYEPDPLRYFLSVNMPETGDSDFSWKAFFHRNNDELVATYGNLVHRVLTITYRNFDGRVPSPGDLDEQDRELLAQAEVALNTVGGLLSRCHFREAIREAMALAQAANRYLDRKAPWKSVRQAKQEAATTLWVAINTIATLKVLFYPFLPFSSAKLHTLLGFDGELSEGGWSIVWPGVGQRLREPQPLFTKLDEAEAQIEEERLVSKTASPQGDEKRG